MSAHAPDVAGEIRGWRVWRVVPGPEGARLSSLTRDVAWPVGEPLHARCRTRHGRCAPAATCGCGIWALRAVQGATRHTQSPPQCGAFLAIGLVRLWGTVCEGSDGWRASHAYPERLALLPALTARPGEVMAVAFGLADYGVPVEIPAVPRAAISGELLVDHLRGRHALAWPFPSMVVGEPLVQRQI